MTNNQAILFWGVMVALMASGMLWAWLAINEMGWLEGIERIGLHIVAWARAQKFARNFRKLQYAAMREQSKSADEALPVAEAE